MPTYRPPPSPGFTKPVSREHILGSQEGSAEPPAGDLPFYKGRSPPLHWLRLTPGSCLVQHLAAVAHPPARLPPPRENRKLHSLNGALTFAFLPFVFLLGLSFFCDTLEHLILKRTGRADSLIAYLLSIRKTTILGQIRGSASGLLEPYPDRQHLLVCNTRCYQNLIHSNQPMKP